MENVIDTPTGIAHLQLFARRQAVHLEGLGMRKRGQSALSICKEVYGLKGDRASILAQLDAMIEANKATHTVWTITLRDETGAEGDAEVEFDAPGVNAHHCHLAVRAEFRRNGWTVVKVAPVVS